MKFEEKVALFQRKKRGQDMVSARREQYREMLKDYEDMKYGRNKSGERVEREITEDAIARQKERKQRAAEQKAEKHTVDPNAADDLLGFVDVNLEV